MWAYNCICIEHLWVLRRMIAPGVPGDRGGRRTCFLFCVLLYLLNFISCAQIFYSITLFIKILVKEDTMQSEISHRRANTVWVHLDEVPCCCLVAKVWLTPWTVASWAPLSMKFLGKNTGVGYHFLLEGLFLIQESNWHLLLGRWIIYHWATREALEVPGVFKFMETENIMVFARGWKEEGMESFCLISGCGVSA